MTPELRNPAGNRPGPEPALRNPRHKNETAGSRREFLGSFLGVLAFWRRRDRKRLAGIDFQVIKNGSAPRRYLQIHGNEDTARQVLRNHLRQFHGVAHLVRNANRNVPILGGELDPNRMFSREGAERNLRTLNPAWPEAQIQNALLMLDRKRYELLRAVWPHKGDVLIALHNNVEYSVRDELDASNKVALNDEANPHEFCLATNENDFALLAKGPYNVVLQNRPAGAEDGSLSRFAAREGFRYVNIEVGLGRADRQREILEWVDRTLPRG